MELLQRTVREDWHEIEQRQASHTLRLWRIVQSVVILSTASVVVVTILKPNPRLTLMGRELLSSVPFFILSLWVAVLHSKRAPRLYRQATLLPIGTAILASLTVPLLSETNRGEIMTFLPPALAVLIPAVNWSVLGLTLNRQGEARERLGLAPDNWPVQLVIGAMVAAVMAFHLLLTASSLPGIRFNSRIDLAALIWILSYELGLRVLAEELIFRGVVLPLLTDQMQNSFWLAVAKTIPFNLLIFVIPTLWNPGTSVWLLILGYRVLVSVASSILRHQSGSLVACLTCNTLFSTFAVLLLVP